MFFSTERIISLFFALSSAISWIFAWVITNHSFAESPLQEFYVHGFSRTLLDASLILIILSFLFGLYSIYKPFNNLISKSFSKVESFLDQCSLPFFTIISFFATALFLFVLNAPGILFGTFMIDDYKMYAIATENSFWDLLWIPINDHVIPLFWLELKTLFYFIGTSPPFLNFPLYLAAIVAIGGAAILLRLFKFKAISLFIIIGLFASTTIVSHQLYGFYAIAPYFQVLAFFILSLIFLVQSEQNGRLALFYRIVSLILLGMSMLVESGGVWTPIAYILFIYVINIIETGQYQIQSIIRSKIGLLIATLSIAFLYATYLFILPHFTSESFYGFNRLPISFSTIIELYHVITAGTLLSFLAPRLGLIISQPTFASFIFPWHLGMFILFSALIILIAYSLTKGTARSRALVPYFAILMLGTSLLVAIARPSSNPAAFYRDQNLLFPLFFLTLTLTVFVHEWIIQATNEAKRNSRIAITVTFLLIVLVSQHVFSFYKIQYLDDINYNISLTAQMRESLTPALNELASTESSPILIPSISALFLKSGNHQLPELSDFSTFIGVENVQWISVNKGSYKASTSPSFIEALKHDNRLRQWYLANGELQEQCSSKTFDNGKPSGSTNSSINLKVPPDTQTNHELHFDIEAQDAPEKIFIDISFNNDFKAKGINGNIRLDQYTKSIITENRRYICKINLNEIPAFALSSKITDFNVNITSPGTYKFNYIRIGQSAPNGG
jgi:hypothetical protein